jgi:hypothetical protein
MADDWEENDWEADDFNPSLPAAKVAESQAANEVTAGVDASKFVGEDADLDKEDNSKKYVVPAPQVRTPRDGAT